MQLVATLVVSFAAENWAAVSRAVGRLVEESEGRSEGAGGLGAGTWRVALAQLAQRRAAAAAESRSGALDESRARVAVCGTLQRLVALDPLALVLVVVVLRFRLRVACKRRHDQMRL